MSIIVIYYFLQYTAATLQQNCEIQQQLCSTLQHHTNPSNDTATLCTTVCCSVLQCVAVCRNVLQYVSVCCSVCCTTQRYRSRLSRTQRALQCVAVHCSVLQNVLQNVLQDPVIPFVTVLRPTILATLVMCVCMCMCVCVCVCVCVCFSLSLSPPPHLQKPEFGSEGSSRERTCKTARRLVASRGRHHRRRVSTVDAEIVKTSA